MTDQPKSRGEELAEKDIEHLQSMSFEELVDAVDTGNNPFHSLELQKRVRKKTEKVEEHQDKVNKLLDDIDQAMDVLEEGEE